MQKITPYPEDGTGYPPVMKEVFTETKVKSHTEEYDTYQYDIATYNGTSWINREGTVIFPDSWVYCGGAFDDY